MGHSRLTSLPRTRKWRNVISLIEHGASAAQVANATMRAAEAGFMAARKDAGVAESVWMLMQLPIAARSDDWAGALKSIGIKSNDAPTLLDLSAGAMTAVDARLANTGRRSVLGEMAQAALAETLSTEIGKRLPSLFAATPEQVRGAFAECCTVKNFGSLARAYFSRVTDRYLSHFLTMTLGTHIGEGRRFSTISQADVFRRALTTHCHEASKIVEQFSGEWFSKTNYQQGGISREDASNFSYGAMCKLAAELKEGAREDG